MKRLFFIILIVYSCDSLSEDSTTLPGNYYIEKGWLAFSSKNYSDAHTNFDIAIETNDEKSEYHLLSFIGKGWVDMYKAKTKYDSTDALENLLDLSHEYFDTALNIIQEIDSNLYTDVNKMDLYVGIVLQNYFVAKQKSANQILWESINLDLDLEIEEHYRNSILYSNRVDNEYIFEYDNEIDYDYITLIKIENYILVGELDSAIHFFNNSDFECIYTVNDSTIVECLCTLINNGKCPFD